MPTPEHNPQSIPPSQIPPGIRICRESEREKLPRDAKNFVGNGKWRSSDFCGKAVPNEAWLQNTYITATPLPESEREVPAASPWIPLSERVPDESDFPVFLYADDDAWSAETQVRLCHHLSSMDAIEFLDATHWQPAATKLPAPPPAPAKTQREKDEAMFNRIWERCECGGKVSRLGGIAIFSSAITTERAHFGGRSAEEVKAELERILCKQESFYGIHDALCTLLSPPKGGTP